MSSHTISSDIVVSYMLFPVGTRRRVPPCRPLLAGCLVASILACGESPTGIAAARVMSVSTEGGGSRLVASADVRLDRPASVEVDYWTAGTDRLRVVSEPARFHHILLPRLTPASRYEVAVRAVDADGSSEPVRGEFDTDTLPTGLAAIRFDATGATTLPLTMLEIIGEDYSGFAAIDRRGTVVWHRPTQENPTGWTRRRNGNFVFLDTGVGLVESAADGSMVASLASTVDRTMHHDVIATPTNTLLFIANDRRLVNDTVWAGEAVWEWDPDRGVETKRWSAFDFLSPLTDRSSLSQPDDWLHANSLSIGPRGNVLMSLFFLRQVISIAPGFGALEWRLGGETGSFDVAPDGRFFGQHTASEPTPGRILLFDNGLDREDGGRYSRALELALDLESNTATKIWEFRPDPDNHTQFVSAARRLQNGNTMVTFGLSPPFGSTGIDVYEVTREGEVLWHLVVEGPRFVYRATPFSDIGGEIVLSAR